MLIINADDFGIGENINRAVVQCFREGICTSTTIMPNMPGFDEACTLAFENGFHLHVGIHLVLHGGFPITADIRRERRFCNAEGKLRLSRDETIISLTLSEQKALAQEIRAQIRKCRERGVPISHLDSHHHVHTEWGIAKVLLPIVREEGIPFVRVARNLKGNQGSVKRAYKYLYNANLRKGNLRATDYFGSLEEYLRFRERKTGLNRVVEVMIHPHYKGSELYVTDTMPAGEYIRMAKPFYRVEGTASFHELHLRDTK